MIWNRQVVSSKNFLIINKVFSLIFALDTNKNLNEAPPTSWENIFRSKEML